MIRGAGAAVAVAVVTMLVCCSADPNQLGGSPLQWVTKFKYLGHWVTDDLKDNTDIERERRSLAVRCNMLARRFARCTKQEQNANNEHNSADRFDASGHKTRNEDSLGRPRLIRDVRDTHAYFPFLLTSQHSPKAGGELAGYSEHKRNFDEIDRSDLNGFAIKRNFDEIDQTSMPFPNDIKRFYSIYSPRLNYLDSPLEAWRSGGNKKRLRPDYPMDEIDLSHFPIGSKRSPHRFHQRLRDYPMDLIDASYFPIGSKRAPDALDYLDRFGLEKKRRGDFPMDEIDASYFPIGSRRSVPLRR